MFRPDGKMLDLPRAWPWWASVDGRAAGRPVSRANATLKPMQRLRRRRAHARSALALVPACVALFSGCASPGPPRPPSLQLPRLVSDLTASREGDAVQIRFTVPSRTTDNLPLRDTEVTASVCRQIGPGPCVPVDQEQTRAALPVRAGEAQPVVWSDALPPALTTGPAKAIGYRVEVRNAAGRSAGYSDPAFTAAGAAPAPVAGFSAQGTRLGVELQWAPVAGAGEVLLQRRGR